jgi:hypothetical protein
MIGVAARIHTGLRGGAARALDPACTVELLLLASLASPVCCGALKGKPASNCACRRYLFEFKEETADGPTILRSTQLAFWLR